MATHSSFLAWRIPWTEDTGRLQSMGPQRAGYDWATSLNNITGFPGGSVVNLPAMQESWVWFLGGEDPLKKEMAIHPSILVWKIPWTEELSGFKFMRSQKGQTGLSAYTTTKKHPIASHLCVCVCVFAFFLLITRPVSVSHTHFSIFP